MVNDKMVNSMRRQYIQPSTATQFVHSSMICGVGSVHGDSGMQYGGGATSGSGISPI